MAKRGKTAVRNAGGREKKSKEDRGRKGKETVRETEQKIDMSLFNLPVSLYAAELHLIQEVQTVPLL